MTVEQNNETRLSRSKADTSAPDMSGPTTTAVSPTSHEEIERDISYHMAQKTAQKMLELGLIFLSEFNKLTQINRDTFSPFLVEIMPDIR